MAYRVICNNKSKICKCPFKTPRGFCKTPIWVKTDGITEKYCGYQEEREKS